MNARFCLLPALAGALLLAVSSAHAEPLAPHQPYAQASLGVRASKVSDAGYDAFSDSDDLVQVSLGLAATLYRRQGFSLAAVGFWDYAKGARPRAVQSLRSTCTVSLSVQSFATICSHLCISSCTPCRLSRIARRPSMMVWRK